MNKLNRNSPSRKLLRQDIIRLINKIKKEPNTRLIVIEERLDDIIDKLITEVLRNIKHN